MSSSVKRFFVALSVVLIASAGKADTPVYHSEKLSEIQTIVQEEVEDGNLPVVIFDVDDTITRTTKRNMKIINDWVAQPRVDSSYAAEKLNKVLAGDTKDLKYNIDDTFYSLGVSKSDSMMIKDIKSYWFNCFFSNQYCVYDAATPGAPAYIQALYDAGARIVYLTGRDNERMEAGTVRNLRDVHHFPLDHVFNQGGKETDFSKVSVPPSARAILMMKAPKEMKDIDFKDEALKTIARMGTVVAGFENEPKNINLYQQHFPKGVMVFLDTVHSSAPDVVNEGVFWVKDFSQLPDNNPAAVVNRTAAGGK